MDPLSATEIGELLRPLLQTAPAAELCESLAAYLELLVRWNARMNLTAVREPRAMVRRHFGGSLALAEHLPPSGTMLDFGSGAGLPGIPVQIFRPGLRVVLAEAQAKKAAFLREAVRRLGLGAEVWSGRVEALPPDRVFDVVTMRAVDDTGAMLPVAWERVAAGGVLALFQPAAAEVPALGERGGWRQVETPGGCWTLMERSVTFHVEQ